MTPLATLPMYDWPEVSGQWDALWQELTDALRRAGFDAPVGLTRREVDYGSEDVLLGQTCGLPFVVSLHRHVTVIGAFDLDLPGCAPGDYNSVLVSRDGAVPAPPARVAISDRMSQSGYAAFLGSVDLSMFDTYLTGAHRQSIRDVAAGRADLAAVDAQSWRLAEAHEPAAQKLSVIKRTPPMPGLPLVTTRHDAARDIRGAISEIFEGEAAAALGIHCLVPLTAENYFARIPQPRSLSGI